MVATTNYKYANSSLNYYVIMMVQNLEKKFQNREFQIFFAFPRHELPIVVCARHVVKLPSKRSVLVHNTVEAA